MRKPRVGINGFGRIGRNVFKIAHEKWDVVAVNDLPLPMETFAHLLQYDSLTGEFPGSVKADSKGIVVGGKTVPFLSFPTPSKIPWEKYKADFVVEAVGLFTDRAMAKGHMDRGVRKVVVTAPSEGEDLTMVMGLNEGEYDRLKHHVVSAASCTANCLAPVLSILDKKWGIARAFMTTAHCYTQNQRLIDSPHKDLRRARMAGINMIPTATTAIDPVLKVLPQLKGRLRGIAIRVPIPNVSLVEVIADLKKKTTVKTVNDEFKRAASRSPWLRYTEAPLVSSDFLRDYHSATIAGDLTDVVDGSMAHVIAWYNNELGYSHRVVDVVDLLARKG
jgi:glyceraldehyde 3-phosphate dehydrogenase